MDELLFMNLAAHAVQTGLLVAGASLLERKLLRVHPGLRLGVWQVVLASAVVLPLVQPWEPVAATLKLQESAATVAAGEGAVTGVYALPGSALAIVAGVLVIGILARLGWIAAGLWRLHRLERECVPLDALPDAVRNAMHDVGASARFFESPLTGPVSFGLQRGIVLLPQRFRSLDNRSQYLIVFHELLHVRRGDALQCLIEELVAAFVWFYPWTWWVRGRIRLAREQVVDRATAATAAGRDAYVRALLGFSDRSWPPVPMAAGLWRARELRARIDALYKEVSMSRTRLALAAAVAAAVVVGVAAVAAATFPLRAASLPDPPATLYATQQTLFATQQQEDDVVKIGGDVKPPKKTKHVSPVYPEDAKEAGIQGVVVIETVIDRTGKVADAQVVKSIPELDQAALDAVLQWEFEPTYVKGKAVSVRMTVTINFTLQ